MLITIPTHILAQVVHLRGEPTHFLGRLAFLGFPEAAQNFWDGLTEAEQDILVKRVVQHNWIHRTWNTPACDSPSCFLMAVGQEGWVL